MPNQSAAADIHPIVRILPATQPSDPSDPVPAMRREMALLRIELEQARAREEEARITVEFLFAHVDRIIDSRDHWKREAERLAAAMAEGRFRWGLRWLAGRLLEPWTALTGSFVMPSAPGGSRTSPWKEGNAA
jgi:hypothetical protein